MPVISAHSYVIIDMGEFVCFLFYLLKLQVEPTHSEIKVQSCILSRHSDGTNKGTIYLLSLLVSTFYGTLKNKYNIHIVQFGPFISQRCRFSRCRNS